MQHEVDFGIEAINTLCNLIATSGNGFVVIKAGLRSPHVAVTLLSDLQTKVYVVESDWEVYVVKSFDLFEHCFAYDKASSCDCSDVGGQHRTAKVARIFGAKKVEQVPGDAPWAKDDAGMLNATIWI